MLYESWEDLARCKGKTDLMFPGDGVGVELAKAICQRCPVKQRCLERALAFGGEVPGVWGGTSENERRQIRRARIHHSAEFFQYLRTDT